MLSVREVAQRLGVKPITIYRAIERGKITRIKRLPSGRIRIDPEELEEELANYAVLFSARLKKARSRVVGFVSL